MNRMPAYLFVLTMLAAVVSACGSRATLAVDEEALREKATETVEQIFAGDYAAVRADFDETMSASLSEEALADGREQFEGLFGTFQSMGEPEVVDRPGFTVINIPLHMSEGEGEARVTYDGQGKIAGLFLLEPGVPVPNSQP